MTKKKKTLQAGRSAQPKVKSLMGFTVDGSFVQDVNANLRTIPCISDATALGVGALHKQPPQSERLP